MRNLFLDTETTGLIPKDAQWEIDYNLFPQIVSIAWKSVKPLNGKIISDSKEFLVYQEGREIPAEATAIHGITTEQGNDPTITTKLDEVLWQLIYCGLEADQVIGFNTYFDSSIIKASVLRAFGPDSKEAEVIKKVLDKSRRVDVMRMAQKFMDGKWAPLGDVYKKLFGEARPGHTALADVETCELCYYELVKRGHK